MKKITVDQLDVRGKRTLVRVDYNVPLNEQTEITDDARIQATVPTIKHLVERGARVILMSHLGRPKGKVVEDMRLKPAGKRLAELLGQPVEILSDCIGAEVERKVNELKPGQVALLENLRFYAAEEKNDPQFAAQLAKVADCYVNDAFGAAHRAHASVSGEITSRVKKCAAGFLLSKEIEYLGMAVQNPPRPFYAVLGGAKVADKIPLIENLLDKVDGIVVGGGMSFTFLKAQGVKIGRSLLDKESEAKSAEFLKRAAEKGVEFLLPTDSLAIDGDLSAYKQRRYVDFPEPGVPDGWLGPDIGPKTMAAFCQALSKARCVVWNGPMGVFEQSPFACGTYVLAVALAGATAAGCVTILGGGDTGAAAKEFGLEGSFSHISTGGGASLEFLGGDVLPGIAALPDQA
jgi:phosphoglycerate kinase